MIYGRIPKDNISSFKNQDGKLPALMKWSGCIHQPIKWGNFSGGIIYDPRLPYRLDDFYFVDPPAEMMVLMSGVIYNRNEILNLLCLNNSTISDPCLVLSAFAKWGEAFVKELNGDFAIFIYNKKNNQSFLYRDHLGCKPLSYSKINDATWFSSDGIALCKTLFSKEGADIQFLCNWSIRYEFQSSSLLEEYLQLPSKKVRPVFPGHYIGFSDSGLIDNKYWYPEAIKADKKLDFLTITNEIKSILKDAVKIRCDQRFIASTHLSGGLDSGIVASLARKEFGNQKDFLGFCWSPAGTVKEAVQYDERELVNKLGKLSNIKPIFTNIEAKDYINFLSDWRNGSDLFTEIKVFENARPNNTNLIFSGFGGDEFISHNDIGINSDLFFKFQWLSFLKRNPLKRPKHLLVVFLFNVLLPALSLRFYSFRKPSSFLSKYFIKKTTFKVKTINQFYHWCSRRDMHLRYLYQHHITDRVEHCAIYGIRNGIEYRYPLIDKRIIEYMLKIPSKLLIKNGINRILIREISKGLLPEEIRWNDSKNDPVRVKALDELFDKVCIQLMDEVNDFKLNRALSFINFELLSKDIREYQNGLITKKPSESFDILIFLKKAHEFTKAYSD